MKIKSIDTSKNFTLKDNIFKVAMNSQVVYQSVVAEMNNARQGTSSTKNRSLVSGGGKKPFRQKGTGNARQGTIRSPLNRGGGVIFGPTPKYFFKKVNAKTKQLAFKCILSDKVKNDSFKVVESLPNQPKTKEFLLFLRKNKLDGKKLTIISSVIDDNLSLASRNVPYISLVKANSCSVKDLFDNELILIDESGLEDLSNRFGGKN
mgnify:CR=1 FL=1